MSVNVVLVGNYQSYRIENNEIQLPPQERCRL